MQTATTELPARPLELLRGVRALEHSTTVAGAYAGRLLAELGAEVSRIATEIALDVPEESRSAVLASLHHGKHELDPANAPLLEASLAGSDVLITDASPSGPGAAPRPVSATLNGSPKPDLVIVQVAPGRDEAGQLDWLGSSLTASASGGLSWVIGSPRRPPLTLPFDIADYEAGVNAASAAVLGLLSKQRGRNATRFEISTTGVVAYYVGMIASNFVPYERAWRREGRRNAGSGGFYPSAMFRCADGYVGIMCRVLREWQGLVLALGSPEWAEDPRFADPRDIARLYADEVDKHIEAWTITRTRDEVLAVGRKFDFPVAPIRTMTEALREPQLESRRFFRVNSSVRAPAAPFRVTTPLAARPHSPLSIAPAEASQGPLSGLRVLDLSWVWSGPMVASIFADLGAEVIKVEHWSRPDAARVRGPAIRNGRAIDAPEYEGSPYFNQINHGKRSLMIDLHQPGGAALVRRLAEISDVLVENMRPGAMGRRGLDYEALSARNPSLIYLSMSMAGQDGPLSDLKGYAPVMSGMAGLESLFGYGRDDVTGMFTTAFGDPNAAMHAVVATLSALRERELTGNGCWIDLSQIEALLSVMHTPVVTASLLGRDLEPPGNSHCQFSPHGHYPCSGEDNWIAIAVLNEMQWEGLCSEIGSPEFVRRWSAATREQRLAGRVELDADIAAWTTARDRDDLVASIRARGVPAAPVRRYEELLASPAIVASGFEVSHPYLGSQFTFVLPWRIDGLVHGAARRAPFLGEHTREDLARLLELGSSELERLESLGMTS